MTEIAREVWITGVGIISSLGEGADAHWQALDQGRTTADATRCAPYVVHPLAPVDFDRQIPRREQRHMQSWQRVGTYAAGLALTDAGLKGNAELLGATDLIVATGTGERDIAGENAILAGLSKARDRSAFLNERLINDLRPRLFLAQLPNLLAANISIIYGVTGSSRTLMGEESAGVDATRLALSRVAGQRGIALVGSAHIGERKDMMLVYEFGGFNLKDAHAAVWQRGAQGGFALGSAGVFLALEAGEHAARRGARALARLSAVLSNRASRRPGTVTAALQRMWDTLPLRAGEYAVISGASGAQPATEEERTFLSGLRPTPVRATGTYTGHAMEAQFILNIALAALCVQRGALFATHDGSGTEAPFEGTLRQAVVTGVGHWRGEGMALVEAVQ